jgi:hypothetical protein
MDAFAPPGNKKIPKLSKKKVTGQKEWKTKGK